MLQVHPTLATRARLVACFTCAALLATVLIGHILSGPVAQRLAQYYLDDLAARVDAGSYAMHERATLARELRERYTAAQLIVGVASLSWFFGMLYYLIYTWFSGPDAAFPLYGWTAPDEEMVASVTYGKERVWSLRLLTVEFIVADILFRRAPQQEQSSRYWHVGAIRACAPLFTYLSGPGWAIAILLVVFSTQYHTSEFAEAALVAASRYSDEPPPEPIEVPAAKTGLIATITPAGTHQWPDHMRWGPTMKELRNERNQPLTVPWCRLVGALPPNSPISKHLCHVDVSENHISKAALPERDIHATYESFIPLYQVADSSPDRCLTRPLHDFLRNVRMPRYRFYGSSNAYAMLHGIRLQSLPDGRQCLGLGTLYATNQDLAALGRWAPDRHVCDFGERLLEELYLNLNPPSDAVFAGLMVSGDSVYELAHGAPPSPEERARFTFSPLMSYRPMWKRKSIAPAFGQFIQHSDCRLLHRNTVRRLLESHKPIV